MNLEVGRGHNSAPKGDSPVPGWESGSERLLDLLSVTQGAGCSSVLRPTHLMLLWLHCPDLPFTGPLLFSCHPIASHPMLPEQSPYSQLTLLYFLGPLGNGFEIIHLTECILLNFCCYCGKIHEIYMWTKWEICGKVCWKSKIKSIWNIRNSPIIPQPRKTVFWFCSLPALPHPAHTPVSHIFGHITPGLRALFFTPHYN